jgi:hypothetical protein
VENELKGSLLRDWDNSDLCFTFVSNFEKEMKLSQNGLRKVIHSRLVMLLYAYRRNFLLVDFAFNSKTFLTPWHFEEYEENHYLRFTCIFSICQSFYFNRNPVLYEIINQRLAAKGKGQFLLQTSTKGENS